MRRAKNITSLPDVISDKIKNGSSLAGDDYNHEQRKIWFEQEKEAYYEDDAGNGETDPWYAYMRVVNEKLGFPFINTAENQKGKILLIGPGPATEIDRFYRDNPHWLLYFIEASNNFKKQLKINFPDAFLIDPSIDGDILLESNSLNAVCSFSVLHHIPNVSKVLSEISRVLIPGGILLVREPCSSCGDWRYIRSATPNERGISRRLMIEMGERVGLELIKRPVPILFEPINKILRKTIGYQFVSLKFLFVIDRLLSKLLSINDHYWRNRWYKKLGPSSYFFVFKKRRA